MTSSLLYDQGPVANRPAAGVEGRIYKPTDESGVFYQDDGSGWIRVPIEVIIPDTYDDPRIIYAQTFEYDQDATTWGYDPSTDAWTSLAKSPHPKTFPASNGPFPGDRLYVFGGSDTALSAVTSTSHYYDLATDTWTQIADLPGAARSHMRAASWDNKVCVLGGKAGSTYYSRNDIYDTDAGIWSVGAAIPEAVHVMATAVVDGVVYMFGGSREFSGGSFTTVRAYDTETDSWSLRTPMPAARSYHGAVRVGTDIYVMGGSGPVDTNWRYDTVADTWETRTVLPVAQQYLSPQNVNGTIYVEIDNNLRSYDPVADSWATLAAMPDSSLDWTATAVDAA